MILSLPSHSLPAQIDDLVKAGVSYPITKTIKHLQPSLSWKRANERASIVYDLSSEFNVPWIRIVAVAFIESSFIHRTHGRSCGFTIDGKYACVYKDAGEMGVNLAIWKDKLGLDVTRALTDLRYGYTMGVRILKSREKDDDTCWVGEYHSYTESLKREYCKKILQIESRIAVFLSEQLKK